MIKKIAVYIDKKDINKCKQVVGCRGVYLFISESIPTFLEEARANGLKHLIEEGGNKPDYTSGLIKIRQKDLEEMETIIRQNKGLIPKISKARFVSLAVRNRLNKIGAKKPPKKRNKKVCSSQN